MAITGIVQGDVVLSAGPVVRSAYLEQVRRIAPVHLRGRDVELAELSAFCTEQHRGPYVWWRAPAWAGKSALLSWFVLHPPPQTQVVSFFITGRFADQDDRVAFIDAVAEQLVDLLGQPKPAFATEATREPHLLRLLAEAAAACEQRSQRLVLVVDGLDEDRGVTVGPDAYSIATLLPARPAAGLRVIVAGRPDPPIPADVPDDHPLRNPGIVRVLAGSHHAQVVKTDMLRELKRLLHGTRIEQDLLGLVAAARGGLSGADLAELTGRAVYDIEQHLSAVTGRTFTARPSRWRPGAAPEVHVLGHEELQITAFRVLGPARLADYRDRLHQWAERYRQRGWPPGTPEYLLRGYYRMLNTVGDVTRMVAYATDVARHNRMRDITGGDAAALTEVTTAQDLILGHNHPDLLAMARLAFHRHDLTIRNVRIPTNLPAVWATLGHIQRAEALAHSIPNPSWQGQALVAVVEAMAAADDHDRAESLARSITDLERQAEALAAVAKAVAVGDHERATRLADAAEAVAGAISDPYERVLALAALVKAVAAAGDHERATRLADAAETMAGAISDPDGQVRALAALAKAMAGGDYDRATALARAIGDPYERVLALAAVAKAVAAGDHERATRLADAAEAVAGSIPNPYWRVLALTALVEAVAAGGDHERATRLVDAAETLGRTITSQNLQVQMLAAVAKAVAVAGDHDRATVLADTAEALGRAIGDPDGQVRALASLVEAVASAGDHDRATALADTAEDLARSITHQREQERALAAVAKAVAAAGDHDRAEALVRDIATPGGHAQALIAVATAVAAAGDHDRAEALVRDITSPYDQAQALAALVDAVAVGGDHDRATRLADTAENLARSITGPDERAQALIVLLAEAVAGAGVHDRAEALVRFITDRYCQVLALAALVEASAVAGDHDRATRLVDIAEDLARSITDPDEQAEALAALVEASAVAGDHDRATRLADIAEDLARSITDPDEQAEALAALVEAVAAAGDHDRAEALARSITDPDEQADALAALVEAVAAAGDHDRAEALARSITTPQRQAEALAALVEAVAAAGDHDRAEALTHAITTPQRQAEALVALAQAVGPAQARALVARAFRMGTWTTPLDSLVRIDPSVLAALADERTKTRASERWLPDGLTSTSTNPTNR